jgi:SAM-dependent methyltransferase
MTDQILPERDIRQAVTERYGARARAALGEHAASTAEACCAVDADGPQPMSLELLQFGTSEGQACSVDGACGPADVPVDASRDATEGDGVWGSALYDSEQLGDVPDAAQLAAAGCGNPIAIAELSPGEAVLDLGSGGGIDCFLAAKQVGDEGEVWGLDMTPDMIQLARHNAEAVGATNVRFRLGEIEDIPFADGTFDVIISNCVINLSTDKPRVFREAFRVLKPGGRLRVSDMVLTADLPAGERADLEAWAGCVAGALPVREYLGHIEAAGFADPHAECAEETRPGITSANVTAVRPA